MVRLKVLARVEDVQAFFNQYECNPDIEHWTTTEYFKFRHNWKFTSMSNIFKGISSSFWVGYQHNAASKAHEYNLVIEYNPNKCDTSEGYLNVILRHFYYNPDMVTIVQVDLACDMPVNINSLYMDKCGKQVKKTLDYGGDNKTIYLGEGDKRVKIYNKAKELGIENMDLTRYEMTLKINIPVSRYENFGSSNFELMDMYCIDSYQFDMNLNGSDTAIIYAVLNGYPLENLERRKKDKIKKILSESAGHTMESDGFVSAFKDYFKLYISDIQYCSIV